MQQREEHVVDLTDLEERLERRACWFEDPAAYRAGVRDTVRALRDRDREGRSEAVRAG